MQSAGGSVPPPGGPPSGGLPPVGGPPSEPAHETTIRPFGSRQGPHMGNSPLPPQVCFPLSSQHVRVAPGMQQIPPPFAPEPPLPNDPPIPPMPPPVDEP